MQKDIFVKPRLALLSISLILTMSPLVTQATVINHAGEEALVPTGKGWGVKASHPVGIVNTPTIPQNGIFYHGGPVMGTTSTSLPDVYFIWYGNWVGNTAINLLTNLAMGIGKTPYYNINSTYFDKNAKPVIQAVNFPSAGIFDKYSLGKSLSDTSVFSIVKNAIASKKLPLNANGVYYVLTSADVNETSGFCTQYCGWHNSGTVSGVNIKYAFVGDAARCPNACSAQKVSPNNNSGADAMASIIAHELEETVTDPNGNAWYDKSGEENGDKCAWKFGQTKSLPTGAKYNITIAKVNYLIQQNWLNAAGGSCQMKH